MTDRSPLPPSVRSAPPPAAADASGAVAPGADDGAAVGRRLAADAAYWQRSLRLTGWLLVCWAVLTFGFGYFAADLRFSLFGWPFSFWVAAQGALIVYCVITWYYALAMDRLDAVHAQERQLVR